MEELDFSRCSDWRTTKREYEILVPFVLIDNRMIWGLPNEYCCSGILARRLLVGTPDYTADPNLKSLVESVPLGTIR